MWDIQGDITTYKVSLVVFQRVSCWCCSGSQSQYTQHFPHSLLSTISLFTQFLHQKQNKTKTTIVVKCFLGHSNYLKCLCKRSKYFNKECIFCDNVNQKTAVNSQIILCLSRRTEVSALPTVLQVSHMVAHLLLLCTCTLIMPLVEKHCCSGTG